MGRRSSGSVRVRTRAKAGRMHCCWPSRDRWPLRASAHLPAHAACSARASNPKDVSSFEKTVRVASSSSLNTDWHGHCVPLSQTTPGSSAKEFRHVLHSVCDADRCPRHFCHRRSRVKSAPAGRKSALGTCDCHAAAARPDPLSADGARDSSPKSHRLNSDCDVEYRSSRSAVAGSGSARCNDCQNWRGQLRRRFRIWKACR